MKSLDRLSMSGLVCIKKFENGIEVWSKNFKNKINNNMKEALGGIICNSSSYDRANNAYINQIRIYGVLNYSDLAFVTPPTPIDDFPTRDYILKSIPNDASATANVIPGANLFSTTIYTGDNLNGNSTYYISDLVLSGKNGVTGTQEVWARVLAPSDSGGPIGLLKTPSISYKIDWYVIFEQE